MGVRAYLGDRSFLKPLAATAARSALLVAVLLAACRDNEPPPAYYTDLGDGSRPLPPPGATWADPALKDGSAEFPPFTPADPDAPAKATPAKPSDGGAAAAPEGNASPEEAGVRAFIKDFNDVVADKDFKELPAYFVKRQRAPVRELLKVAGELTAKFNELIDAIDAKSPGAADPLKPFLKQMEANQAREINIASLTVVSPTEVTGKLVAPPGLPVPEDQLEARFVLSGEDWEVELKQIDVAAAAAPALQAMVTQFDGLIESVQSGSSPPDAVVGQLVAGMSALMPAPEPAKPSDN